MKKITFLLACFKNLLYLCSVKLKQEQVLTLKTLEKNDNNRQNIRLTRMGE